MEVVACTSVTISRTMMRDELCDEPIDAVYT